VNNVFSGTLEARGFSLAFTNLDRASIDESCGTTELCRGVAAGAYLSGKITLIFYVVPFEVRSAGDYNRCPGFIVCVDAALNKGVAVFWILVHTVLWVSAT
jgi:hypothetical protein